MEEEGKAEQREDEAGREKRRTEGGEIRRSMKRKRRIRKKEEKEFHRRQAGFSTSAWLRSGPGDFFAVGVL